MKNIIIFLFCTVLSFTVTAQDTLINKSPATDKVVSPYIGFGVGYVNKFAITSNVGVKFNIPMKGKFNTNISTDLTVNGQSGVRGYRHQFMPQFRLGVGFEYNRIGFDFFTSMVITSKIDLGYRFSTNFNIIRYSFGSKKNFTLLLYTTTLYYYRSGTGNTDTDRARQLALSNYHRATQLGVQFKYNF